MWKTLSACLVALMATTATAEEWPDFAPEPPPIVTFMPDRAILCDTLDQVHALADDMEDASVPIPRGCGKLRRPVPFAWTVLETYDTADGWRYWVVVLTPAIPAQGLTPQHVLWLRKRVVEIDGEPV